MQVSSATPSFEACVGASGRGRSDHFCCLELLVRCQSMNRITWNPSYRLRNDGRNGVEAFLKCSALITLMFLTGLLGSVLRTRRARNWRFGFTSISPPDRVRVARA